MNVSKRETHFADSSRAQTLIQNVDVSSIDNLRAPYHFSSTCVSRLSVNSIERDNFSATYLSNSYSRILFIIRFVIFRKKF